MKFLTTLLLFLFFTFNVIGQKDLEDYYYDYNEIPSNVSYRIYEKCDTYLGSTVSFYVKQSKQNGVNWEYRGYFKNEVEGVDNQFSLIASSASYGSISFNINGGNQGFFGTTAGYWKSVYRVKKHSDGKFVVYEYPDNIRAYNKGKNPKPFRIYYFSDSSDDLNSVFSKALKKSLSMFVSLPLVTKMATGSALATYETDAVFDNSFYEVNKNPVERKCLNNQGLLNFGEPHVREVKRKEEKLNLSFNSKKVSISRALSISKDGGEPSNASEYKMQVTEKYGKVEQIRIVTPSGCVVAIYDNEYDIRMEQVFEGEFDSRLFIVEKNLDYCNGRFSYIYKVEKDGDIFRFSIIN